jgi:hypothetical protein
VWFRFDRRKNIMERIYSPDKVSKRKFHSILSYTIVMSNLTRNASICTSLNQLFLGTHMILKNYKIKKIIDVTILFNFYFFLCMYVCPNAIFLGLCSSNSCSNLTIPFFSFLRVRKVSQDIKILPIINLLRTKVLW